MNKASLIITDLLFVIIVSVIYADNDLKKHPVILAPLISLAFASRIIGHINYYKLTKKIY